MLFNDPDASIDVSHRLADSAANYAKLRIYYKDNDGHRGSVDVYDPNSKTVCLTSTVMSSDSALWVKTRIVKISGTTVETEKSGTFTLVGQANVKSNQLSHIDVIAVVRVEGWH